MLTINEEMLRLALSHCTGWMCSPEAFLGFICIYDLSTKVNAGRAWINETEWRESRLSDEACELGEIFMRVIPVDLKPYRSFADILEYCVPAVNAHEQLKRIITNASADNKVLSLLDELQVLPARETIELEVVVDMVADRIIASLKGHITFH